MKKLLAFALMFTLVFAVSASAQDFFDQGLIEIGGSVGFSSSSGDLYENAAGDGSTSMNFSPMGGYFVIDNLSVGAVISYSSYGQGDYSSSSTMFGPVFEYYYSEMMGPGYIYGSVSYMLTGSSWDDGTNSGDASGSQIRVAPGYFVPVNDKVGLTAELFYSIDDSDGTGGSVMGLTVGFKVFK